MTVTRLTGLTSGLDTDQLVKDLMKVEQMKYDKVAKNRQKAEWEQEAYRTTIKQIQTFQDEYLDILNTDTGIRSVTSFSEFTSSVQINGEDSKFVTVQGSASATVLKHEITSISQLAKKDEWISSTSNISSIQSKEITSDVLDAIKANGVHFNIRIDGNTELISIDHADLTSVSNVDDLVSKLNDEIKSIYGNDYNNIVEKIDVDGEDGIKFDSNGNEISVFNVAAPTILSGMINSNKSGIVDDDTLTEVKKHGMRFDIKIGDVSKHIDITAEELDSVNNIDELITKINDELQAEFGSGYNNLVTKTTSEDGDGFEIKKEGSDIEIKLSETQGTLGHLGIVSSKSNTGYLNESLSSLFELSDEDLDDFKINGVAVTGLKASMSLDDFMKAVNKTSAKVTISYNNLDNRFNLTSDNTGIVNNIDFSDSADAVKVFGKLGFDTNGTDGGDGSGGVAYRSSGKNAIIELDGQTVVKADNEFSIDGLKYTLNNTYTTPGEPIEIELKRNIEDVKTKITKFVEDYNALIATINSELNEKKNRDYEPLTAEEKKALSEDEIKQWEAKAKEGILYRDQALTSMLDQLRTAFYDSVEGAGVTLTEIGITTSNNYKDRGKLVVDEDKLTDALENNYSEVVSLFTNVSDKDYMDYDNSAERYRENGIANRLNDIISNAVRTTRNPDGLKGTLIEKAGLVDDASVNTNSLSKELSAYDKRLEEMLKFLQDKETTYYNTFAKMEAALSELNQQSASLVQQLGS